MGLAKHTVTRSTSGGCAKWIGLAFALVVVCWFTFGFLGEKTSQVAEHIALEDLKQKQLETGDIAHRLEQARVRRERMTIFMYDTLDAGYVGLIGFAAIAAMYLLLKQNGIRISNSNNQRFKATSNGMLIDVDTSETYDLQTGMVLASPTTMHKLGIYGSTERIHALTGNGQKLNAAAAKLAAGYYDRTDKQYRVEQEPEQEPLQLDGPLENEYQLTQVSEWVKEASSDAVILGYGRDGYGMLDMNPSEQYHLIIAGASNYGKSWLTLLMLAQLNKIGNHIVVFDCRKGLVDYQQMVDRGQVEGYNITPDNMGQMFSAMSAFAEQRQDIIRDSGAKNWREYERITGKKMQRYVFLIEELGAFAVQMSKSKRTKTVYKESLATVADLICWCRMCNISLVVTTQVVRGEFFRPEVKGNSLSISFRLTGSEYASIGTTQALRSLAVGQFICTSTPRTQAGDDFVWSVPHSEEAEQNIAGQFKEQRGRSFMADIELFDNGEGEYGVMEPKYPQKVSYEPITQENNPDLGYVTQRNPAITQHNPVITQHNSVDNSVITQLENAFEGFDWDSVDWVSINNMKSRDRYEYLRDTFPKLPDGDFSEQWHVDYLCFAYNVLEAKKSDICYLLFGSKGNRMEWLNDAIDDYLSFEDGEDDDY